MNLWLEPPSQTQSKQHLSVHQEFVYFIYLSQKLYFQQWDMIFEVLERSTRTYWEHLVALDGWTKFMQQKHHGYQLQRHGFFKHKLGFRATLQPAQVKQ